MSVIHWRSWKPPKSEGLQPEPSPILPAFSLLFCLPLLFLLSFCSSYSHSSLNLSSSSSPFAFILLSSCSSSSSFYTFPLPALLLSSSCSSSSPPTLILLLSCSLPPLSAIYLPFHALFQLFIPSSFSHSPFFFPFFACFLLSSSYLPALPALFLSSSSLLIHLTLTLLATYTLPPLLLFSSCSFFSPPTANLLLYCSPPALSPYIIISSSSSFICPSLFDHIPPFPSSSSSHPPLFLLSTSSVSALIHLSARPPLNPISFSSLPVLFLLFLLSHIPLPPVFLPSSTCLPPLRKIYMFFLNAVFMLAALFNSVLVLVFGLK